MEIKSNPFLSFTSAQIRALIKVDKDLPAQAKPGNAALLDEALKAAIEAEKPLYNPGRLNAESVSKLSKFLGDIRADLPEAKQQALAEFVAMIEKFKIVVVPLAAVSAAPAV